MLAFGTGIALLPESTFSFAHGERLAPEAATTTIALLLVALLLARLAGIGAAHGNARIARRAEERPRKEDARRNRVHVRRLCARAAVEVHLRPGRADARGFRADIDAGKGHDQIISEWITKYGGEHFLSMPLDGLQPGRLDFSVSARRPGCRRRGLRRDALVETSARLSAFRDRLNGRRDESAARR